MIIKLPRKVLYNWFPVLPFLAYWIFAYLSFYFGPFRTPELNAVTHVYVALCLLLFVVAYKLGLGTVTTRNDRQDCGDNILAIKILRRTSWLTFVGTLLFVVDRITSGAGSFDLVVNNMADIRQDFAGNTTFLTTVAILPQSFYLVTLASYFYCGMQRKTIPRIVHILIFSTFACEIMNMVLSANRGALFWIATYAIFYSVFCLRLNLFKVIFSRKNIFKIALIATFSTLSFMYFLFVAEHRVLDTTAIYLGKEASYLLKEPLESNTVDYAALGAKYQLFYYFTHGFTYVDAILKYAPAINFDFLSPLGVRVESQIARFSPGYVYPAKENIIVWVESAGLSRFGWPTTFGATLAYFGSLGSLLFFYILGFIAGYSTRSYIRTNQFGWLLIVFTLYASLNMSFDWILRDFTQYVAVLVGLLLIYSRRNQPIPRHSA